MHASALPSTLPAQEVTEGNHMARIHSAQSIPYVEASVKKHGSALHWLHRMSVSYFMSSELNVGLHSNDLIVEQQVTQFV